MRQPAATPIAQTYQTQGFAFPIDVFTADQMAQYRAELARLEPLRAEHKLGHKAQFNYPHVVYQFANDIARTPRLLDVVEQIIGPNIMLWGSTFFFKEARSDSFVSWHQDLRYWGLSDPNAMVSAWLALGPVTRENGCMRFVPGSHRGELVAHRDTYSVDNFLYRGQEADVEIDENQVAYCELAPGQLSLHHGNTLHASSPNHSDQLRLGFVMNFIAPHNQQTLYETDFAMLVRGEDTHGYYQQVPSPETDLSPESLQWHQRILETQLKGFVPEDKLATG